MSDTPPSDTKDDRVSGAAPEPFVRGRIVWGRPPETVFRAGPLPRAPQAWGQPAPRPAAPQPRPATDIFTGSMIPPRAVPPVEAPLPGETPLVDEIANPAEPETPVAAKPRRARKAAPVAEPAPEPEVVEAPVVEAYADPAPDVILEPVIETIVEPEPVRPATPPRPTVEIIVEPEAPEQIDTMPPPLSGTPSEAADPRAMPSVVVTPTLYARVEAVVEKVKANDRWLIAAVVGVVVVTGGFIWLATLPSGDAPALDMDAPPPAAPGAEAALPLDAAPPPAAEAAPPPVVAETPTEAAPTRASPGAEAAPTRPAAPRTAPAATPRVTPPVTETAPPPVIDTAPLVVESPTAAAPAPTDPDAPIETRPQPLT
jgi:Meckel syndrome type 1 protein